MVQRQVCNPMDFDDCDDCDSDDEAISSDEDQVDCGYQNEEEENQKQDGRNVIKFYPPDTCDCQGIAQGQQQRFGQPFNCPPPFSLQNAKSNLGQFNNCNKYAENSQTLSGTNYRMSPIGDALSNKNNSAKDKKKGKSKKKEKGGDKDNDGGIGPDVPGEGRPRKYFIHPPRPKGGCQPTYGYDFYWTRGYYDTHAPCWPTNFPGDCCPVTVKCPFKPCPQARCTGGCLNTQDYSPQVKMLLLKDKIANFGRLIGCATKQLTELQTKMDCKTGCNKRVSGNTCRPKVNRCCSRR